MKQKKNDSQKDGMTYREVYDLLQILDIEIKKLKKIFKKTEKVLDRLLKKI